MTFCATRATAVLVAAFLLVVPAPAGALEISLPSTAKQTSEQVLPRDSYTLPLGPHNGSTMPVRFVEGSVVRRTWRLPSGGLTTLQILDPIREQVEAAGFRVVFACRDTDCGGFDFRFATEIAPAPDMHVNLRNFRFLSAVHPAGEVISLLVSAGRDVAHIQVIHVDPEGRLPAVIAPVEPEPEPEPISEPVSEPETDLSALLLRDGHVVLSDLEFATGADSLNNGAFESLATLAAFLTDNPSARIAVVGHTDTVGTLERNIDLSRRRAEAVRQRLIDNHGGDPDRITADGVGFLAPAATNLTPAGREANRRVEAVLLSLE